MMKYHMTRELQAVCESCMNACQACIIVCQKLKDSNKVSPTKSSDVYQLTSEKSKLCIKACEKMIEESQQHLDKCIDDVCREKFSRCIEQAKQCIKACGELKQCDAGSSADCANACQRCIERCDECYEACQEMMQLMA